jgi:hypothetical protein
VIVRTPPLLLLLAACDYQAPINPFADPVGAVLSGTVVNATGQSGNVIVLAYDATNPGPPYGTGRPVTFTTVGADAFTTDAASGMKAAPFSLTDLPLSLAAGTPALPERSFLVTALLDVDGNFNPVIGPLAGATCGDWIGAYLTDLVTLAPAAVKVEAGGLVDGVTVVLASPLGTQRPAFFSSNPELSKEKGRDSFDADGNPVLPNLQTYVLTSTAVHTDFAATTTTRDPAGKLPMPLDFDGPCPTGPTPVEEAYATCETSPRLCFCDPVETVPCETSFQVWLVDADADGEVDPYPSELQAAAGLKDVWPRVYLAFAGDPIEVDGHVVGYTELDLDQTNNVLAHATPEYPYIERWIQEGYPFGVELTLGSPVGDGTIGVPFPMNALSVLYSPVYRHYYAGGTDGADANGNFDYVDLRCAGAAAGPTCTRPVDLDEVPSGLWQVTVIEHTGQTWSVPNEIGWYGLPSTAPEAFDPSLQTVGTTLVQ